MGGKILLHEIGIEKDRPVDFLSGREVIRPQAPISNFFGKVETLFHSAMRRVIFAMKLP